jgi:hypothetical protein
LMLDGVAARLKRMFRRRNWLPPGADVAADGWEIPRYLPTAITGRPSAAPPILLDRQERRELEQTVAAEECEWEELVAESIGRIPKTVEPARPPPLAVHLPPVKAAPPVVPPPPTPPPADDEGDWSALLAQAKARAAEVLSDEEREWSERLARARSSAVAHDDEWAVALRRAKLNASLRRPAAGAAAAAPR